MSSRPGASNQSRERKRRAGLRSDMQDSGCEAGNGGLETKQAAGKRLFGALLVAERVASRGRISHAKIAAAERKLGDVGTRKAHSRKQFSSRRITPCRGAVKQTNPDAAFGVGHRSIRMTCAIFDSDEDALVGRAAILGEIKGVDCAGAGIGVIEDAPIGTEARTVGDHVAAVDANRAVRVETVERTCFFLLAIIHGAEPKPAAGIECAIV